MSEFLTISTSDLLPALESANVVGTWDWNIPADRVYTDDVVALLFGVDPDQASLGLPIEEYAAGIHAEDREWVVPRLWAVAKTSGPFVAEYRTCPCEGSEYWVLARGRFYLDAAGRPLRSRGIIIDITDRKLGTAGFASQLGSEIPHLLERAADHCMALRETLIAADQSFLLKLTNMILLELGRELSAQISAARRRLS